MGLLSWTGCWLCREENLVGERTCPGRLESRLAGRQRAGPPRKTLPNAAPLRRLLEEERQSLGQSRGKNGFELLGKKGVSVNVLGRWLVPQAFSLCGQPKKEETLFTRTRNTVALLPKDGIITFEGVTVDEGKTCIRDQQMRPSGNSGPQHGKERPGLRAFLGVDVPAICQTGEYEEARTLIWEGPPGPDAGRPFSINNDLQVELIEPDKEPSVWRQASG